MVIAVAQCRHGEGNIHWEDVSGTCTECYDFNWDVGKKPYGGVSYWRPIQIPSLSELVADRVDLKELRIHKTFSLEGEIISKSRHVGEWRYAAIEQ